MEPNESVTEPMDKVDGGRFEANADVVADIPPRLMITKMVLENFKSYAGVKEIGPFHKCFSSVVGPNGSGKSNVIDAMLFVFGKRAKKLRLNKVSELIHKSDAVENDPPQFARVSVFFQEIIDTGDGDDDYKVVPHTETVVTRIAKKDNSSTYKLDGKNSSFKEIAAYLNSKGIDLDNNRFLILQGEVEMISLMPPKGKSENDEGLLEYLEDIIGSSKYVEATNQAGEKVEALTEVRQEKLNRVKAVEKEMESLEGAKQEAESLLAKEREIRRKQAVLYQIHTMNAEKEHERLIGTKTSLSAVIKAERETMMLSESRIDEIESNLKEQKKDYEVTCNELKRTKEEFIAFERKDIKLREEIKHERSEKKKLREKILSESKKIENAAAKREAAEARIPVLQDEINQLVEMKAKEDANLEILEEGAKGLTQTVRLKLEQKLADLAPVREQRASLQAAFDTAETELKICADSSTRAKQRLEKARKELASIDATKRSKMKEITDNESVMKETATIITALEKEDLELSAGEASLDQRHTDLVNAIEDAKYLSHSVSGKGKSKAVDGILGASKKGGELCKVGILGRLGDLATISEKYDVAISTACGGMLDNIVVQTTAGAQKCLEFLRQHNLGRASFIPLDKLKKGAHDRPVETPEGAQRLFDLLTPLSYSVTPALFLAVGNTLVAPDMDTASRWAYDSNKRWRVVTLSGSLIEATGTMSGGGKSARKGGMRLQNSRAQNRSIMSDEDPSLVVEKLEKEATQVRELLHECKERRLTIRKDIRNYTKKQRSLELSIPKLKLDVEGCETTREELTRLIPELEEQCNISDKDKQVQDSLAEKVQHCKSELLSFSSQAEDLENEVLKLKDEILEAGGPILKKQKASCQQVSHDLKNAEKQLSTAKVEIVSADKTERKNSTAKAELERKLSVCEDTLSEKETEFRGLESGALDVMNAFEQVKLVESQKRTALDEASKEMEALKKSLADVRCKEIEVLGQLEAVDKQLFDNRKRQEQWSKKIEALRKAETNCVSASSLSSDTLSDSTEEDSDGAFFSFGHVYLESFNQETIEEEISTLEAERNILSKSANMGAIEEYRKKESDYLARVKELDQITDERNSARKEHEELRRKRLEMFMDGFGIITLKLKEMYQMITLGGDAELELVDSLDPFSEGIVFSVRPPKKSWKNISNLSGGEKTLSSLSLVFALHHYKPTPLYVMDEIDAALDFKNVSIVANYIKERTKNAQFIIISLRNNMFELADRLVGIYKTNNCTKSVTINPRAFGISSQATCAFVDKTNRTEHIPQKAHNKSLSVASTQSTGEDCML